MLWTSGFRSRITRECRAGVDRHAAPFTSRTSTGPSPAPISTSPCRTAAAAAAPAPRAASSSERPRASRAASVAECVQPAPCVARDVVPLDGKLDVLAAVEEMVDRGLAVAAGDERGRSAELDQPLGQVAARRAGHAGQRLRLGKVRRHDRGEREQAADQRLDGVVLEQLCARACDQHRVDDERNGVALEELRHRLDDRAREEHPGLRRVDADVVEDGLQLRADEVRRQLVHRCHRDRVLGGERDDGARPVRARGGKRLQIGLDAGAAARVGRGNRQHAWNHSAPFARHGGTHGSPMRPLLRRSFRTNVCAAPAGQSPAPPASVRDASSLRLLNSLRRYEPDQVRRV